MTAISEVALIAGALAALVAAALTLPGVVRVLLIAQAIYWGMSYVARPIVLLWVRPDPRFGDNIADPRLARLGYGPGLELVLQPVVFGLWLYAGVIVAYAVWARSRRTEPTPRILDDPVFVPTLWALYALGTLARLAAVATGSAGQAGEVESASPVLSLAATLATVGAVGLIVFARPVRAGAPAALILVLMAGELWWTVSIESKTPIMGAALAVAVRFALTGWTRRKIAAITVLSVAGVGGFGWLQSLKATPFLRAESAATDAAYPPAVQPFLSLLRRFDLLEAATDAAYRGPSSWLSAGEVAQHAVLSLIPGQLLGVEKFQSGTAWASEVRGASVDMSQISVSLAEGNVNEGYVLAGYPGVALGVLFTAALLLAWSRAIYARNLVVVVMAVALIEVPVVFERGMLGSVETVGKYLQTIVLVVAVYFVVAAVRTDRVPAPAPRTAPVLSAGRKHP
ncbi:hypothetical protein [Nocardia puris]|uniref:O-antigen polysaccharide polymerase Wzy-like protein n=1 Tax=Nocardia puris TaxID=208602 RepID=A0A366DWE3_9NOCA|nr:hypothetical protein [Nocardia puris]RBO94396.1 hypothetical protein DFR74_102819 [Nocardia puris]